MISPLILVTGSTGLVGSQLLLDLVRSGKQVRAMKKHTGNLSLVHQTFHRYANNDAEALLKNIEWVEGDVLDTYSLLEAMKEVKQVYHCAAVVSFGSYFSNNLMKINVEGTENVVNMALEARIQKLCHISSVAALGRAKKNNLITEETHWEISSNNSLYAVSKYGAEREVWRGIAEGLNAVIVNPSIIIGAGDWKRGSSKMFEQGWKGLKYYTEGINGFVDVRDVSSSMTKLMDSEIKNERFIISSENYSYRDFYNEVSAHFQKRKPYLKATPFLSEIAWRLAAIKGIFTNSSPLINKETARTANQKYFYSNEKIKKTLGIEFIPVKQSIKDTCAIFLKEVNG